jgi:hypothetical protein
MMGPVAAAAAQQNAAIAHITGLTTSNAAQCACVQSYTMYTSRMLELLLCHPLTCAQPQNHCRCTCDSLHIPDYSKHPTARPQQEAFTMSSCCNAKITSRASMEYMQTEACNIPQLLQAKGTNTNNVHRWQQRCTSTARGPTRLVYCTSCCLHKAPAHLQLMQNLPCCQWW